LEEKKTEESHELLPQTRSLWNAFLTNNVENLDVYQDEDKKILEMFSRIKILQSSEHEGWLQKYGGTIHNIPVELLKSLKECAPDHFHARVMDFNENLLYQMQEQSGLEHFGIPSNELQSILRSHQFLLSFMSTETTNPQPAHVDFTWEFLEENEDQIEIGFFPLTSEGMFLQIWPRNDDAEVTVQGEIIYIPYGKLLTVSPGTIHGGGFRTTLDCFKHGNLRSHLYISKGNTHLGRFQTNKYTEPFDRSKELSERYVDSPILQELVDSFFVKL
jgi:hypothetical protein